MAGPFSRRLESKALQKRQDTDAPRPGSKTILMSSPLRVSRETARQFLVARHFLAPPRSLQGGPEAVMEVIRRLGSIQFDPIAVAGRNHDLVLHARVAGYDPAWSEELLYARRALFETNNKALSLVPVDELPWYRVSWWQAKASLHAFHVAGDPVDLDEHRGLAAAMVDRIRAEGPLTALDFESGKISGWFGTPISLAGAVLERLYETGVLSLARRDGNRKSYDLTERLFPADLLAREVPLREQLRHKMLSRFRAHGLLGVSGTAMDRIGPPRPDPDRPDWPARSELRQDLIDSGKIVPVEIETIRGTRYVVDDEVDLLLAPPGPPPSVAFLPPQDSLMWDGKFLTQLFDFKYVLEIYLPQSKRRWGYYVLPVVFRDRLVGRIEPRIDRTEGRVRILGLWWESAFDPAQEEGFVDAMREALAAYLRFARATELEWAQHLDREKRLFSTRPQLAPWDEALANQAG